MNVGASHNGEDCDRVSMPENFTMASPTRENTMLDNLTMGTGMPENPTREDTIPERSFWRVPWFKSPCRRFPRWRRPAWRVMMDKTMPKLPSMDKAVTESPCRKASRWRQPDQRAPRGRTPCRRDYSRECHDSENPAVEFRDGEDHSGE